MKRIALLATATLAVGYSHGRVPTVMVKKGKGGEAFRINKSEFDADQEGDKEYTEVKVDPVAATRTRSDVNVTGEVLTTPAPSAPNFNRPEGDKLPIDTNKNAVAPTWTTADQLLVMKQGKKFYITDGMGQKITGDRAALLKIDEKGYDSEEAAKAVQTHTNPEPSPN